MTVFIMTTAIAAATAALQVLMKGISRTDLPGKRHGLTTDDALFWTDWTLSGALSLVLSVIVSSSQGKEIPQLQVLLAFIFLALGCSAFPYLLKIFAYDPGAKIKRMRPFGIGWILIANFVGMVILLSAVATGVTVYELQ